MKTGWSCPRAVILQNSPWNIARINDNGLVALALLIAESDPKQKDLMIRLIMNMLAQGEKE